MRTWALGMEEQQRKFICDGSGMHVSDADANSSFSSRRHAALSSKDFAGLLQRTDIVQDKAVERTASDAQCRVGTFR